MRLQGPAQMVRTSQERVFYCRLRSSRKVRDLLSGAPMVTNATLVRCQNELVLQTNASMLGPRHSSH